MHNNCQSNEDGGYLIWPVTPITFEAIDDMSGVNYIHYDIWWDTDGDMIVDILAGSNTIYSDTTSFTVGEFGVLYGLIIINWYAVDNAENIEDIHIQEHFVMEV